MISPAFFDWGRPKIVQSPTTKFVHYLQGENDIDQLCCVLRVLGTPSESVWPVRNNLLTVVSTRVESFPLGSYNLPTLFSSLILLTRFNVLPFFLLTTLHDEALLHRICYLTVVKEHSGLELRMTHSGERDSLRMWFLLLPNAHSLFLLDKGVSELPDYKKISFPEMPPIPLEEEVPDASPEVRGKQLFVVADWFSCSLGKYHVLCSSTLLNKMHSDLGKWLKNQSVRLQAVDLLKKFLVYSSHKRISANEVRHITFHCDVTNRIQWNLQWPLFRAATSLSQSLSPVALIPVLLKATISICL